MVYKRNIGTSSLGPWPAFLIFKLLFRINRYGREEMLALYTRSEEVPEELQQFTHILSEKAQEPLAFQPLSEEEQVWSSFDLIEF